MRARRADAVKNITGLSLALAAAAIGACASVQSPRDAVDVFEDAVLNGDIDGVERLGSPSAYNVVLSSRMAGATVLGCVPDVGGGERCTVGPAACAEPDQATLTLHLDAAHNQAYHVTSAAVAGVYRTLDTPDFGTGVLVQACGLRDRYSRLVSDFLTSEIYSTTLVPWPYAAPPGSPGDSAIAASRLATNRGTVGEAVAALQRALALGESATTITTTAVVEAGFTLGLHIALSPRGIGFVWNHDALAYPTDTTRLRDAIALLDFAMDVPHPGVDWHRVAVIGHRYAEMFTHTPSIAAMEEMNGTAHYMMGRALTDAASRGQSCALWTSAHDALATGYRYLENVPKVDEADNTATRLAKDARTMAQNADSARVQVCRLAA